MPARYIGLAGLGFLGRGIAICLLDHGFHVVALETNASLSREMPPSERLIWADSAHDLKNCELVIESITESLSAKQALFQELEDYVGPAVPIATNTSAIPITLLQTNRKHPNRFAGMHWTAPAYATRFLEIVRGDLTDDATLHHIEKLARELDKEPAIVHKDIPGFVANRLAYAMFREAVHLLEEGVADVETIDILCQHSLGLWTPLCGPFRWMDITGGAALYATAMERIVPTLCNESQVQKTMLQMQSDDSRGTRNRKGFYDYGPDSADEWNAKLHEHALQIWEMRRRTGNR